MSYVYADLKPDLLTDAGQQQFIRRRDKVLRLVTQAGAVTAEGAMSVMDGGDSWLMLAALDRMVELGDLIEIPNTHSRIGQHRVFVKYRQ